MSKLKPGLLFHYFNSYVAFLIFILLGVFLAAGIAYLVFARRGEESDRGTNMLSGVNCKAMAANLQP